MTLIQLIQLLCIKFAPIKLINMASIDIKNIYKDRLNPQFIGISQKLHSAKKNRLSLEHQRNYLKNNLIYKIKVENTLQNKLQQNKLKLTNVKWAHQRHLSQLQNRRQRSQQHKARLMQLHRSAKQSRQQNKQSIRSAIYKNHAHNSKKRQMINKMAQTFHQQLRQSKQYNKQQNQMKYKSTKSAFYDGKKTVNNFFKKKNLLSLNNYRNMIQQQECLTKKCEEEIEEIEQSLGIYDNKIERKKEHMYLVLDKIHQYTHQPIKIQSRCLPLYLRQNTLNTSYHSSRPSDIILNGYKRVLQKDFVNTEPK